ncbi:MAG TPA: N-formylglutamate deformylase [Steroidobacteraceae bacterium]
MDVYDFHPGTRPLLISIPHAGTEVPADIQRRFTAAGRQLADTDWFVDRLYGFARDLGASIISARYSRYVVDLNRSSDSSSLYPGAPTSPVCPALTFDGRPIYAEEQQPHAAEIGERVQHYWQPYHARIAAELEDLRHRHGAALLWDAHSIASSIPALFTGRLPEFNFGTRDDASCPQDIARSLRSTVEQDGRYSSILNGRFKGGYITEHYGRPALGICAVQLELAQRTYMDEASVPAWSAERAQPAADLIARLLGRFLDTLPRR